MADLRGFDAEQVEPNDTFDPIPGGDYLCIITASAMKPTKAGDGRFLELELEVIDGDYKGRKLWDRLNVVNANETAVKIAKGTLSAICRAVGILQPKDSCELHDIPLVAKVRIEKRADTDEPSNVVRGYKSRPTAGGIASRPSSQPGSTPPWKRPTAAAVAADSVPF